MDDNYKSIMSMENVIFDGWTYKDEARKKNIELLKGLGFIESGDSGTSGQFALLHQSTQSKIVFTYKSNIGGKKFNKYFSLKKVYKDKERAEKDFVFYKHILKKKNDGN